MIRILHIITDKEIGGGGKYLLNLLKYTDYTRFKVDVSCPGGGKLEESIRALPVNVIPFKGDGKSKDFSNLKFFLKLINSQKYDIVHTHASIVGRLAARLRGVKAIVYTKHGMGAKQNRLLNLLSAKFLTTAVIAVSDAVAKFLVDSGIPKDKVFRVYNGVDLESFESIINTNVIMENELNKDNKPGNGIGLPNDVSNGPIIGTIARLSPEKGHTTLLESAKLIIKKYPQSRFMLIGDGPLKDELKEKAKKLGIENNVEFLGYRQDIPNLIKKMDIFVLPSISEGFGLAVIEAMASGVPVVASNTGGLGEVIIHKVNGWLVNPKDIKALEEAILTLLKDQNLNREIRKNAIKRAQEFSAAKMAEETEKIYIKLLN